jgi:hypothetical protein
MVVVSNKIAGSGRPLRVLMLLGLGLGVWVMLRLPILQRDLAQAGRAFVPMASDLATSPLRLVSAPGGGVSIGGGSADLAVAQAELEVASAELNVARARLRLVQVQHGGAFMVLPAAAMPTTMVGLSPPLVLMAARRLDATPSRRGERWADSWSLLPSYPAKMVASVSPMSASLAQAKGPSPGYDYAAAAYSRLAEGDRRGAARLFDAALAAEPETGGDPHRAEWLAERRRLGRRWSGEFYSLVRGSGPVGAAASPVLGGGQSGGGLAWTLDPLARRPIAVVARFNAATDANGAIDNSSNQAGFGLRWRPRPGISLSAERLVAIGYAARNDWALRIAAGADGKRGRFEWSSYAEAGVLGAGDAFAGAQARAVMPVFRYGKASFLAGAGSWASIQTGGVTTGRFDIGPSLVARAPMGRTNVDLSADWRFRAVGNAMPGSGPALTLSTGF